MQFAYQLRAHFPVIERSEEKPNGFFALDLGNLRMMWVGCYDQFGSCAIFFVTHCEPVYGAEIMVNFIDELRSASTRAGFKFGVLNGPMYEAEPDVCRILAHGNVV
ncbi:hypothetical protein [Nocardia abscessus]|uniref:hypothetical protein n=1 Tax=Nocardia abscessus TaxID=120957 RepID=UPI0024541754|nr:hypothetical protein [Nocardia abscessus]